MCAIFETLFMQGQCNGFFHSFLSIFIVFLISSHPDSLVLLNEVDYLSIYHKIWPSALHLLVIFPRLLLSLGFSLPVPF